MRMNDSELWLDIYVYMYVYVPLTTFLHFCLAPATDRYLINSIFRFRISIGLFTQLRSPGDDDD